MKNIFTTPVASEAIARIHQLSPNSKAIWGKMDAAQMLAHCNVTYELVYENIHPKPNGFTKLMLKLFVKNNVVNEKPYGKSGQTAPVFIIKGDKDFTAEKNRLIDYINKTQALGEHHFHQKESASFGVLTKTEWNNMFYKHLDHHLSQFGV
jgi:hypothetical protein